MGREPVLHRIARHPERKILHRFRVQVEAGVALRGVEPSLIPGLTDGAAEAFDHVGPLPRRQGIGAPVGIVAGILHVDIDRQIQREPVQRLQRGRGLFQRLRGIHRGGIEIGADPQPGFPRQAKIGLGLAVAVESAAAAPATSAQADDHEAEALVPQGGKVDLVVKLREIESDLLRFPAVLIVIAELSADVHEIGRRRRRRREREAEQEAEQRRNQPLFHLSVTRL